MANITNDLSDQYTTIIWTVVFPCVQAGGTLCLYIDVTIDEVSVKMGETLKE